MVQFDITDQNAIESYVVKLEEDRWRAESSGMRTARAFYEAVLDSHAFMLMPGGVVLDERDEILRALPAQPWTSYELDEPYVVALTGNVAVVSYGVLAHRKGAPAHSAQVSSTYVRRAAGWKLALLQQTPRERLDR